MDLAPPDLDHAADGNRLITPQVEHPLQDEVGVQTRGPKGSRVAGLQSQGHEHASVQSTVMIGIARQHEMVSQNLGITGLRFGHVHRVSRPERKVAPVGIEPTTSRL